MMVANATGCTSIYSGSAPSTPYCKNADGRGPAWANSLFEDNAEFGLGMYVGAEKLRDRIQMLMEEAIAQCQRCSEELKGVMREWIEARVSSTRSAEVAARLVPLMEACGCDYCRQILELKDFLVKQSQWVIGGDGWAYDIGFGGLDHVLGFGAGCECSGARYGGLFQHGRSSRPRRLRWVPSPNSRRQVSASARRIWVRLR